MIAEWIVGLLATIIAAPVAIASYVSARRAADAAEQRPPSQPAHVARYAPARPAIRAEEHRHYHRHLAA